MVDIERAPEAETPAYKAGMRSLADVVSGCLPPAAILRRGR